MTRRAERIPGGPLSMEIEMNPKPMHRNLFASTAVAIGVAVSLTAYAAQPDAAGNAAPILLAQAGAPTSTAAMQGVAIDPDLGAVNLRGVRKAAAQGPNELRRYIFRTRMIYNFDYEDWAPKP
jgi:hypothetical protein